MPSRKIDDCIPELQDAWNIASDSWHTYYPELPQPFLTCTHRSGAEQDELYAIGRTKPGKKITNARAGQSLHNQLPSRAFDVAFVGLNKKLDWNPELFKKLADILKTLGVEWGGDWKSSLRDLPHFQISKPN